MKNAAAGAAMTTLAALGGEAAAQETRRVAPEAVYEVAPGLGHFTDDVLFGEVWPSTDLAPRDRSLVTVAALVSSGKIAQIGGHAGRALDNGVTPAELGELLTQLALYSGWPNAISAVFELKAVFDARGIAPVTPSTADRIPLPPEAEAARAATVATHVAPTAPKLAELTDRVLFGDLWQRPELSPRDRSLVTMAALVAIGQPEQLPFHANRAMDNGLSAAEAAEVVTHVAFYAGWPRAMSAVPVLKSVLEARRSQSMTPATEITHFPANAGVAGPADYFTGEVRVSGNFAGDAPARISGATVTFQPSARTAWHDHPLGQTLYIISGTAWVQREDGPLIVAQPGDVVFIPAGVKHWHGATPDAAMTHLAFLEQLDGKGVTWMEKVSDADYLKGAATE